jgi:hypothetical protein
MLSLLFALTRRLHQPARLAVVVAPLALVVCCALAAPTLGIAEQPGIQTQAFVPHGDYRDSPFSAGQVQAVNATGMAACCVPKAVWPLGKSQLARRIAERWAPGLFASFGAFRFEPSLVVGPTMPRVLDASSPEYLTLRQLRL